MAYNIYQASNKKLKRLVSQYITCILLVYSPKKDGKHHDNYILQWGFSANNHKIPFASLVRFSVENIYS